MLFLSMLGLVLGFAMPHLLGLRFSNLDIGPANTRTLFRVCLAIGAVGVVLRFVDLVVLRGVSLAVDITENRKAGGDAGASGLSTAAAVLAPFAFAALVLSCCAVRRGIEARISPLAALLAGAVMLLPIVFGSRSTILLAAGQLGCLAILLLPRITPRMVAVSAVVGVVMIVTFAVLFMLRFEQTGVDYKVAARYSAYTHVTPLHDDYLAIIDTADREVGVALAAYASIVQYYTHGLFEFFWLIELKSADFSWGDYQFFFVSKFWNVLTGQTKIVPSYFEFIENPRAGVFQGLYGPAFIDFGYFSFAFLLALGFVCEVARLRVRAGDDALMSFYVYLLFTMLLAPCLSGIIMSGGSVTLTSFFAVAVLGSMLRSVRGVR